MSRTWKSCAKHLVSLSKVWDVHDTVQTSYFIRGSQVSAEEYREACKTNMTLERMRD